jgi:hypothetical protein
LILHGSIECDGINKNHSSFKKKKKNSWDHKPERIQEAGTEFLERLTDKTLNFVA